MITRALQQMAAVFTFEEADSRTTYYWLFSKLAVSRIATPTTDTMGAGSAQRNSAAVPVPSRGRLRQHAHLLQT